MFFHKPPHSIVLISGDRDFSRILNFMESVHYDVIMIHSSQISEVLKHTVTNRLLWRELMAEDNASVKPVASKLNAKELENHSFCGGTQSLSDLEISLPSSSNLKTFLFMASFGVGLVETLFPCYQELRRLEQNRRLIRVDDISQTLSQKTGFKSALHWAYSAAACNASFRCLVFL